MYLVCRVPHEVMAGAAVFYGECVNLLKASPSATNGRCVILWIIQFKSKTCVFHRCLETKSCEGRPCLMAHSSNHVVLQGEQYYYISEVCLWRWRNPGFWNCIQHKNVCKIHSVNKLAFIIIYSDKIIYFLLWYFISRLLGYICNTDKWDSSLP